MRRTLLMTCLFAVAAAGADISTIERTERDFGKALTANDFATLDRLLAPELVYTHSGGNTDTKIGYLDSLKAGTQKYREFEYQSLDVKPYGDTAVIVAVVHVKSVTKGTASESHLKILHVWIKKGMSWQLVAHQSTKLP